jgi:hypothetical protein
MCPCSVRPGRPPRSTSVKGWLVAVDGRIEFGEWETESGEKRHDYSVVGKVEFLTAPAQSRSRSRPSRPAGGRSRSQPDLWWLAPVMGASQWTWKSRLWSYISGVRSGVLATREPDPQ